MKRNVDVIVISDVHLGTYGCHAQELLHYLKSVNPSQLILNGDIVDIWQFKKSYFPDHHFAVIRQLLDMAYNGCEITYITGNHDELLRNFSHFKFGNIQLANKLVLNLGGKNAWIFHGDVFDMSIQHSKWLAKLGGWGYDRLIQLNKVINWGLMKLGKEPYSLSKKIKNKVKKAVKFISDFENTAIELAVESRYDYVICGHIHHPQIRQVTTKKGRCTYLNSGDWIENLTALEYHHAAWSIFNYEERKSELGHYSIDDVRFKNTIEDLLESILKSRS